MMLFPAMMVGGQLLIAVVDKVPELNFEPICREAAGENRLGKDDLETCRKGETDARDALAKEWSEFGSADRARCVRLSSSNRTASYVEVLTCLEMDRDAKKMHRTTDTGIAVPEQAPARETIDPPPVRSAASRPPPPAPLVLTPAPPDAPSGLLQALCLPGLKAVLPACSPSGGSP
jgi:hypothetical protein